MISVKRFYAPGDDTLFIFGEMKTVFDNVNFEEHDHKSEITSSYGVKEFPTILYEKEGKEIERIVGVQPRMKYIDTLRSAIKESRKP